MKFFNFNYEIVEEERRRKKKEERRKKKKKFLFIILLIIHIDHPVVVTFSPPLRRGDKNYYKENTID